MLLMLRSFNKTEQFEVVQTVRGFKRISFSKRRGVSAELQDSIYILRRKKT